MLRLAIMSDLHCHHSLPGIQSGTLLTSDLFDHPVSQNPITSLLQLIGTPPSQLTCDALLLPGDITHRADSQGLITGVSQIERIAKSLGVKATLGVVGNHDVDSRGVYAKNPFELPKNMKSVFPGGELTEINHFWAEDFAVREIDSVEYLLVNSCARHTSEEELDRGSVSTEAIEAIGRRFAGTAKKRFRICILHHHPLQHKDIGTTAEDIIETGEHLLRMLSDLHFDLVVHGHKHQPRLSYYYGGASTRVAVFAAASFSAALAPPLSTRADNLFHIVHLSELAVQNCTSHGTILSWFFSYGKGWAPSPSVRFPHETGFGCHVPASAIAADLVTLVPPTGLRTWAEILTARPEYAYLPPDEMATVESELRGKHGIAVFRSEGVQVETVIGRTT